MSAPGASTTPTTSTTPTPSAAPSSSGGAVPASVVAAWQQALAAEHAAIFGYGTLGPHLPAADVATARAYQTAHRALRDGTLAALATVGVTGVTAAVSYPVPFPLDDAVAARRLAVELESACASGWRYLLACAADTSVVQSASITGLRARALGALQQSAVRALTWRAEVTPAAPSVAFPGI